MPAKWLIDAHNLMHKLPHARQAYQRNRLEGITIVLQCVDQLCRKYQRSARLVFDGHALKVPDRPEHCSLEFSGNKPADLVIRNILQKKSSLSRWIVISDDREVQSYARQADCKVYPASTISKEYSAEDTPGQDAAPPSPGEDPEAHLNDEEVEEWKKIFGIS